ncbi:hypothetical protein PM082_000334 [Marasmius tenuissimus]|nr:hypothetical protein PM082_000334 [Marasmius tenuissimus]
MYYLDGSKRDVCLVLPYLASGNLTRYLKRTPPKEIDSHGLVYDIATGIEYLHSEDIVHGDLKGPNILIRVGLDFRIHACICDFGLSRLAVTHGLGPTMSCWGITNGCTAPEVIRGRLSSKESDMCSFGSLCYEIIGKFYGLSPDVDRDFPPRRLVNLPTDKKLAMVPHLPVLEGKS